MDWWKKMYARAFPASKHQVGSMLDEVRAGQRRLEAEMRAQSMECRKLSHELNNLKKEMAMSEIPRGGVKQILSSEQAAQRRRTPITLLNFVYHLADHCNLNCKCCDHFSPIAEEKLADLDSFKRDIKRLGELCGGYARRINLQGGEPLLHPRAVDFAATARESFPVAQILFTTNGILLLKQEDRFWETCAEYDISIEITKYPIGLPYGEIQKKADAFGVACHFYGNTETNKKCTYLIPLDPSGRQDIYSNFSKCRHANECIMLKEGRMYTCTVAPNIEHFNRYFDRGLYLSEMDSIDIYKVNTMKEITEFLAKPIPFCRYCNVDGREYGLEWGQSTKSISEWVK